MWVYGTIGLSHSGEVSSPSVRLGGAAGAGAEGRVDVDVLAITAVSCVCGMRVAGGCVCVAWRQQPTPSSGCLWWGGWNMPGLG